MKLRTLTASLVPVALAASLMAAPTTAAAADCPAQSIGHLSAGIQPVVLAHGWNGNANNMDAVATYLERAPKLAVTTHQFNYGSVSYKWASQSGIADCLAEYITQVSTAHKRLGGSGKVIVVAHSMGGLAARFATDSRYANLPIDDILGGLVTFDTPHLGSPFGSQPIARAAELKNPGAWWPFPKAGTDGSRCLALHDRQSPLPNGCAYPPYLPTSVPLTQIAGDITVKRSLFGVPLYDINLGGDGIVWTDSSQGYLESGPLDTRAAKGSQVTLRPEPCSINLDQIGAIAVAQGLVDQGGWGSIANVVSGLNLSIFTDNMAMDDILGDRQGPTLMPMLLAANIGAKCSHTNVLHNASALDDAAEAIRGYIQHFRAASPNRFVGHWTTHGGLLDIKSDGTATESFNIGPCHPEHLADSAMCNTNVDLKVTPTKSGVLLTVTRVSYSTWDGIPQPPPPDPTTLPGDQSELTVKDTGLLFDRVVKLSGPRIDYDTGFYWCGKGVSKLSVRNCGA
ncbi:esterase/lipase family protein [Kribbella ginsengisoli]|uniref:DUF676 domain-containing protein n=1 Tax=Kribbella ginsengisoli TaxID=363865 RepID=A0ABP6VPY6_9ACTN